VVALLVFRWQCDLVHTSALPTPSTLPAPRTPDVDVALRSRRSHWVTHVARHAQQQPAAAALRFCGRTTTWSELAGRSHALADALHRRGVRAGDRVALLMTNRPEYVEALLATTALGAIAVPLNFRLTAPELAFILADSGARMLVVDPAMDTLVDPVLPRLLTGPDYEAALREDGNPHPEIDVAEGSPALIMYTSGTTGSPKGAVLSHANLAQQSLTLIRGWQLFGDDTVNLCASPMFHIAAVGVVAPLLLIGGTTVIHPSGAFDPGTLLDTIEQERVTCVFLVPAQWQAVCAVPGIARRELALRVMSWGAAPATDSLLHRMSEVFPTVVNVAVFGQTEMSPVTCLLQGTDALRKLGSVGRPVATVAARVVDATMQDVPPGEVGEIVYRGPTLMQGYWNNPEATAEGFAGGWFHSGDLVRVDPEGFVFVVDRVKDMIITGGENVYCAEVENVLAADPDVVEAAVIGRADPRWGEFPVAVLVAAQGAEPTLDSVTAWCRPRLAGYKLPREVVVLDALPRNASGKVLKGTLRQAHGR